MLVKPLVNHERISRAKLTTTRHPEKHVPWVDRILTRLARERYCEADAGRAEPVISSPQFQRLGRTTGFQVLLT
jgi:hypothetical protein